VSLQPDVEDTLVWKWTQHGLYSSNSAYRAQFLGSYINHKISLIWRARTENKCKFFAWVLIRNKLLTTDNLARRGWPHQPSYALCNGPLESGLHLCLTCPFAQEVWNTVLRASPKAPQKSPLNLFFFGKNTKTCLQQFP